MIFSGYYGMGNYGDDLFGHAVLHGAKAWWGREAAVLAPPLKGADEQAFAVRNPLLARYFAAPGALGGASRLATKAVAPLGHHHLVYGGGSVFSRVKRLDVRKAYALAAQVKALRLGAIGVSAGPFRSREDEEAVAKGLEALDYIALRDDASYEYVAGLGLKGRVVRSADLAATLPKADFPRSHPAERAAIGINICPALLEVVEEAEVFERLVAVLHEHVLDRGEHLRLFSLQAHESRGDTPLIRRLHEALASDRATLDLYDGDAKRMWGAIGACKSLVSTRLHGAITAYLQGVPFVLLGYHPKCGAFAEDVGLDRRLFVETGDGTLSGLEPAVRTLLEAPPAPSTSVAAYEQKALLNFTEAPWAIP